MPFRQQVASEEEFKATIIKIEQEFKAYVIYIRYKVGSDWSGEDCLFFRVLLHDMDLAMFREYRPQIQGRLQEEVGLANIGWFPHFRFRTEAEQKALQDKDWE